MESYKASKQPNAETWLALDEAERLYLIEEYIEVSEKEINDETRTIHACAHMIVENQLALKVKPTLDACSRLMRQGLNRHETIHAIAAVIFADVYDTMKEKDTQSLTQYKSRLRKLTAKKWLKGKY